MIMKNKKILIKDIGKLSFSDALQYQEKIFNKIINQKVQNRSLGERIKTNNFLILTEHSHVYTIGKSGDISNLLIAKDELIKKKIEFYKTNMEGTAQQAKIDTETAQAQAEQELRQEWGRDFESKVKQAGALAKANMNAEVLDMTLQNGVRLGDHPEVIRGFAKIASMMQEDKIVATESENVNTSKDLESEISAIMNDKNHPYHVKGHPDHDKSVQQMLTLREMLDAK